MVDLLSARYKPQLEHIFNFYSKLEDFDLDQEMMASTSTIQCKTFVKFANQFKIVPTLLEPDKLLTVFNYVMRNKAVHVGKETTRALVYDDFLEALVRVAVLAKRKLGLSGASDEGETKDAEQLFDLTGVDADLIEKLLKFMNLTPGEKKTALIQFLKRVRTENQHAVPAKKGEEAKAKEQDKQPEEKGEKAEKEAEEEPAAPAENAPEAEEKKAE